MAGFNSLDTYEEISHLDFDAEIECEATRVYSDGRVIPDCIGDGVAVWMVTRSCCKDKRPKGFFCDPCLQDRLSGESTRCPTCLTQYVPPGSGWTSIDRIK